MKTSSNKKINSSLQEFDILKSKPGYLVYNRKSTDEPENQKNSIQYQTEENIKYARKHNLYLSQITIDGFCTDGVITEKHSAFKENDLFFIDDYGNMQYQIDRPKFARLVQLLHQGYVKGVIVLCWDRISRNKSDETIIRRLMNMGVEFRFALTTYDDSSSGALHMDIDGMFAIHHSRVTSEKVRLAVKSKKEKGHCVTPAPVGYLNIGSSEEKPIDPIRAPIIKQLFDMYATGEYSISELEAFTKTLGVTMPKRRKKRSKVEILQCTEDEDSNPKIERDFSKASIHRILRNPFYMGKIRGNNHDWILSTCHTPIVTDEVFHKVQYLLSANNQCVKHTSVLDYPLRGYVRCGGCHRTYTPYIKKGIQYYYAKCAPGCENNTQNISFKTISEQSSGLLEKLQLPDPVIEQLLDYNGKDLQLVEAKRQEQVEKLRLQKKKFQEDLNYLQGNKLELLKSKVYSPESLMEEEHGIELELSILAFNEGATEQSSHDTFSELQEISELLNNLTFYMKMSDSGIKERILKTMCSELLFSKNTLTFKLRKEFDFLNDLKVANGAPLFILPELPTLSHTVHQCLVALQTLKNNLTTPLKEVFHPS